jgi:hypothetical protein
MKYKIIVICIFAYGIYSCAIVKPRKTGKEIDTSLWVQDSLGTLGYRDSMSEFLGPSGIVALRESRDMVLQRIGRPNKILASKKYNVTTFYYTLSICDGTNYKELFIQFKNRKVSQYAIWNPACTVPYEG